ncbi:MAG: hypothetical protein RR972_00655 [Peptostreptococcus sp.]
MLIAFILFGFLNLTTSIIKGLGNIFLNMLMLITGVIFVVQLFALPNMNLSIKILFVFSIMLLIKIVLSFFPAAFRCINRQVGNCLSFWF